MKKNPQHILDMHKPENLIFATAIHGDAGTLRGGKGAQDFVERGFNRDHVHVRPGDHDFAHLHLAEFDGADDEFFFARSEESALASLLDWDLQLLGGMRRARSLRL